MSVAIGFDAIGEFCQTRICQDFRPARNVKRILQLEIWKLNRNSHVGMLIPNSLHVFQQHLLAAAVIKLGSPAVGVAGDALGCFQGAVIF